MAHELNVEHLLKVSAEKTVRIAKLEAALSRVAEEVESLAFQMRAPNEFTPQFVMLAQFARGMVSK